MTSRNPAWSRDELILALDLYVRSGERIPGHGSSEILELSETLNALAAASTGKDASFRNPNGVYMKLMNFRRFDPDVRSSGRAV